MKNASEATWQHILAAPRCGVLQDLYRRPAPNERERLEKAQLDTKLGLLGDDWSRRPSRRSADGGPNPLAQLTIMSTRVLSAITDDKSLWPLAGDQLYVDMDLSQSALPAGTRLAIGSAIIEVTAEPHTGCAKFSERFGPEALRFISSPRALEARLRGLNARVIQSGEIQIGDSLRVIESDAALNK